MLQKLLKPFNGDTLRVYAMSLLAALSAGAILLGVNTAVGITHEAPRITIGDSNTDTVIIVPNVGDEGYPVSAFCEDPLTTVKDTVIPGSTTGHVYELIRVRDGVPEMVVWNTGEDGSNVIAQFDYNGRGPDEPMLTAVVDDAAKQCIEEKAGA